MDVGTGAGFYVNATEAPWARTTDVRLHHRGARRAVNASFVDPARIDQRPFDGRPRRVLIGVAQSRALSLDLRRSRRSRPRASRSGDNHAFTAYFGTDRDRWREYDVAEQIRRMPSNATSYS